MDNFDLKKFLTENKLTQSSRLVEANNSMYESGLQENSMTESYDVEVVDGAGAQILSTTLEGYPTRDDAFFDVYQDLISEYYGDWEGYSQALQGYEGGVYSNLTRQFDYEVSVAIKQDGVESVEELTRLAIPLPASDIAGGVAIITLNPTHSSDLQEIFSTTNSYQVDVVDGAGEEILSAELERYPDFETVLFDVVQDLVSEYYVDVDDYIADLEGYADSVRSVRFNTLGDVLNYEINQAGGMRNVKTNGLSLVMPSAGRGEVHIKIVPM